jgi:hypothetical protein
MASHIDPDDGDWICSWNVFFLLNIDAAVYPSKIYCTDNYEIFAIKQKTSVASRDNQSTNCLPTILDDYFQFSAGQTFLSGYDRF